MAYLIELIISVGAQVIGYFLCKWLDPDKRKGKQAQDPRREASSPGVIFCEQPNTLSNFG